MWWKIVVKWLKEQVDVDVNLELGDGVVAVDLTVRVGEAKVLSERLEWALPEEDVGAAETASRPTLKKVLGRPRRFKRPLGDA